jgi:hypothetical protein
VVEASIAASHDALLEFTGNPVIGVFQTLSAGNAGQFVPGMVVPAPDACSTLPDHVAGVTRTDAMTIAERRPPNLTCRRAREVTLGHRHRC